MWSGSAGVAVTWSRDVLFSDVTEIFGRNCTHLFIIITVIIIIMLRYVTPTGSLTEKYSSKRLRQLRLAAWLTKLAVTSRVSNLILLY